MEIQRSSSIFNLTEMSCSCPFRFLSREELWLWIVVGTSYLKRLIGVVSISVCYSESLMQQVTPVMSQWQGCCNIMLTSAYSVRYRRWKWRAVIPPTKQTYIVTGSDVTNPMDKLFATPHSYILYIFKIIFNIISPFMTTPPKQPTPFIIFDEHFISIPHPYHT
jgi:hypothetical protein